MSGILLPRPLSFFANSIHFAGGLVVAWGMGQWHSDWLAVLVWFVAQEVLVQQAKYQWNDLRDQERDRHLPANQSRPSTSLSPSSTLIALLLGRWAMGLLLGVWLSPWCGLMLLALTLLQIVYELVAKPQSARWPLLSLLIVGLGAAGKFLGGALAAGWPPSDPRLWVYGLMLMGMGAVYGSTLWRTEGEFLQQHHLPFQRGQTAYFLRTGQRWLVVGSGVIVAGGLWQIWAAPTRLARATAVVTLLVLLGLCLSNSRVTYERFNLLHWRTHQGRVVAASGGRHGRDSS